MKTVIHYGLSLEIVHQISFETKFNTFILCLHPTGLQKMVVKIEIGMNERKRYDVG